MHYVIHIEKEKVFPLQTIEFEGEMFPVPKDTDAYLTSIFGKDYMQIPPKSMQKVHSVEIIPDKQCRYERESNAAEN